MEEKKDKKDTFLKDECFTGCKCSTKFSLRTAVLRETIPANDTTHLLFFLCLMGWAEQRYFHGRLHQMHTLCCLKTVTKAFITARNTHWVRSTKYSFEHIGNETREVKHRERTLENKLRSFCQLAVVSVISAQQSPVLLQSVRFSDARHRTFQGMSGHTRIVGRKKGTFRK